MFGNAKEPIFTYPCLDWAIVISLVKDNVEKENHEEDGVIGEDSLDAGELAIIDHIQPGGEEEDPGGTIQAGFH